MQPSHEVTADPKSIPARLSAGMMPFFIPPTDQGRGQGQTNVLGPGQRPWQENADNACLDPNLMTPPMSPTEQSFDSTIHSRFTSSTQGKEPAFEYQQYALSSTNDSNLTPALLASLSSPAMSTFASSSSTGSLLELTPESRLASSPRPLSFHWEDYKDLEDEDDQDSGEHAEAHEDTDTDAYYHQFEGHHSLVRRSSYSGVAEMTYDSMRHGIGLHLNDMSEEIAKAKLKMNRAGRAMRNIEVELEAMQRSIDQNKATSATARTALEENAWRLECLALSLEKDRQEVSKQLQAVGRDCNQAVETVTNWEVRIDWLGRRVDNTSEYVSELVLSEQECMSFVKMIIQQNRRYAMPAISRSTERNIKLLAPPKLKEITPTPNPTPTPAPTPRLGNIPISWLLDPILPPKPPELTEHAEAVGDKTPKTEPPAELWRDFSRLTLAFENGQPRTPFSPFQRARTRSSGGSLSLPGTTGQGSAGQGAVFKPSGRRPQVENMSPMPKILPAAVSPKMPAMRRRSQNIAHLPVHSWLQLQFNKTMTSRQTGATKTGLGFTIFQKAV